jgi:hypothetical protein
VKVGVKLAITLIALGALMFAPSVIYLKAWKVFGLSFSDFHSVLAGIAAVIAAGGKIFEKVTDVPAKVNNYASVAVVVGGFYFVAWGLFAITGI